MDETEFARRQWAEYAGDEFMVGAKAAARWRELRRWIEERDSDPEWGAVDLSLVLDKMAELEAADREGLQSARRIGL